MKIITARLFTLACATLLSSQSYAAGFYIQEQSVSGLGNAFAGSAVTARDASVIYYNPAGMTYLDGRQGNIGVHLLAPISDVDDRGSDAPLTQPNGEDSDNPYGISPVPNLNYSHQLNDNWWGGVSVTAPFGLSNEYDDGWFGRYDSTSSELLTINVQPSFAVKIDDKLSFGGGIDIQYVDAELKNQVFFGVGSEGISTLEGDDISYGYNLGFIYEPNDATKIGAHYRSQVNHKLDGEVSVVGTGTANDATSDGKANLNLPEILSLSASHDLGDQWTIMAGATWFGWSNYEYIGVNADNNAFDSVSVQNYKNTWAFNIGADYKYSDEWIFRGGLQFDPTPTQDNFRTTRTPDGDRVWVSGGATYQMNNKWSLDMAATYINVGEEDISLAQNEGTAVVSTVEAKNSGHVGIVAVGLNYKF
jgi:long-chain fatty acid transport protein